MTDHDFPTDRLGRPLAWPAPSGDGYVDAWNGWYDSREFALAESVDWEADENDRLLAYGEDLITESQAEARRAAKPKEYMVKLAVWVRAVDADAAKRAVVTLIDGHGRSLGVENNGVVDIDSVEEWHREG